ncbi:DNA topoisomerase 3-alpha [Culicoides brevitarsis]|uniref:DNA topoisomerase 3-alpha n=1 Tax=Culicoides brevitarsis TaxID=469753 RepID=UPI00307BCE6F
MVRLILGALNQNVMKFLNVAEKNDAAKTIAGLLSRGTMQRREGFSKFNKIYEFDCQVQGQHAKMVMTSVSGHLLSYGFSQSYRSWNSCDPQQLFDAPVIKQCSEQFVNIRRTLEREVRSCQKLIIWTDCDREGENIGFEIIDVCRGVKPNIAVFRAKFSEITEQSVRRALNNLAQPDKRQSDAVDVRSELDLRIGAAFTRFQTLRLQKAFPTDISGLVSYGSCQFPTLGFVAKRYRDIENFIPQNFWKLKVEHKVKEINTEFSWARNRLFEKSFCESFLMLCQANPVAEVTNVVSKPKSKWRPTALDTVELEKLGSRKLKLSAKTTMTIAEKLYTKGFISYPRTETNIFSKEIDLQGLVQNHVNHPDWGEFSQKVLDWGPNPRNGKKSDQAHPPIHPLKVADGLSGDEKKVYDLIARHFLACLSKDAQGSETVVTIKIADEEFSASGLIVLEKNYLEVYPYDKWNSKEIHDYQRGETFEPTELGMVEGKTSAPNLLTEADLVALMEKHGIGTDATHAEHINTIKERLYIAEQRGFLTPNMLGIGLVEGYEAMTLTLAEPELRAGLELELKQICDGVKNPKDVLRNQISLYKEAYRVMTDKIRALDDALSRRLQSSAVEVPNIAPVSAPSIERVMICNKCKTNSILLKRKKNNTGYYLSCDSYPSCQNTLWLPEELESIEVLDQKCEKCGNRRNKMKFKLSTSTMRIMGTTNRDYTCCIFCDQIFKSALMLNTDALTKVYDANNSPPAPVNAPARQNNFNGRQNPSATGWRNSQPPRGKGSKTKKPPKNQNFQPIECPKCKAMTRVLTVKKDGPNKGRQFHLCETDGFVKFADEVTTQTNSTGNNRGRASSAGNTTRTSGGTRKCGLCRSEGHTRNRCPNNRDDS